ncbi:DUF1016 N-terminal domain-containing protein [Clostridium sp. AM58-1XD]|uniref:DUF1016 N-terminal domain-containing protein n=1 Tax=Clostridium sp. AM58-1XD TaxID=2292307 RepID=UPI001FA8E959|nr:DUF1016 N-terminal domain-containing protein [Clostridium sp. AM58-1XD]
MQEPQTGVGRCRRKMLKAALFFAGRLSFYWNIGKVIVEYSQWGSKFVENLSKDLRLEYPGTEGYSVRNLNYMKQSALRLQSEDILHQIGAKIS